MDWQGTLYGTTQSGGTANRGTVFKLTPPTIPGGAWTETVLHSFTGPGDDGEYPLAGLIMDQGGALYGTTQFGGAISFGGTVFRLTPPTSRNGKWTEKVLHSFAGIDGSSPEAELVMDHRGTLYGTTVDGGSANFGTVFALAPPRRPGGAWTETVLHSFTGPGNDGAFPATALLGDPRGTLYGMTAYGGSASGGPGGSGGWGTVFCISGVQEPDEAHDASPNLLQRQQTCGAPTSR
jgi:uncharacterized repeat protein (TIGR03803 family)